MYLIWRMDTTDKGAKKNTSPNVIHLQYILTNIFHNRMTFFPNTDFLHRFMNGKGHLNALISM